MVTNFCWKDCNSTSNISRSPSNLAMTIQSYSSQLVSCSQIRIYVFLSCVNTLLMFLDLQLCALKVSNLPFEYMLIRRTVARGLRSDKFLWPAFFWSSFGQQVSNIFLKIVTKKVQSITCNMLISREVMLSTRFGAKLACLQKFGACQACICFITFTCRCTKTLLQNSRYWAQT